MDIRKFFPPRPRRKVEEPAGRPITGILREAPPLVVQGVDEVYGGLDIHGKEERRSMIMLENRNEEFRRHSKRKPLERWGSECSDDESIQVIETKAARVTPQLRKPHHYTPRERESHRDFAKVLVEVPQLPGVRVLRYGVGKAVRSYSKVYVPLIFCALGEVPLVAASTMRLLPSQTIAREDQIAAAMTWWSERFSCWELWVNAIRKLIETETRVAFLREYIIPTKGVVPLIFGQGASSGFLPHPHARNQERILAEVGIDGEIACCIAIMTSPPHS